MSGQDRYERILESLHAGMLDDTRWDATSGLIDEFCGTKGNHLVFGDGAPPDDIDIFFARFCYLGQRHVDLEREYFEVWHGVDERLPRIRSLADSRLASVRELFSEEELKTSAVHNELMPRTDTRDSLAVRLDGPSGSRIVWTFADPVGREGWSRARVKRVERLLPHVRQFVRVRQALVGAKLLGSSMVTLLDHVGTGVIQLDRRGRVVVANDRARAMLRAGTGLTDRGGELRATRPEEHAVLQRLLARALPSLGGPGVGGAMTVRREDSASRLVVHVSPVREGGPEAHEAEVGALVLVVDPMDRTRFDPERVREALNLTRAESQIAVLLAQGKSVLEVAEETGRQSTTVKWHIRHIYDKLGLSRRVELAGLVMWLADVPGVGAGGGSRPGGPRRPWWAFATVFLKNMPQTPPLGWRRGRRFHAQFPRPHTGASRAEAKGDPERLGGLVDELRAVGYRRGRQRVAGAPRARFEEPGPGASMSAAACDAPGTDPARGGIRKLVVRSVLEPSAAVPLPVSFHHDCMM